ncbi:ADP-forming succinate--CoA ligase subunit beta [Candidatus Pelagibacter bacterium]|nr:ADP-forming succinate--CoA ligase subunit beta [Candidatus Pelagibacter bacterium]
MNIHEYQAKEILKEYGAPTSNGVIILNIHEIKDKIKKLNSKKYVLKAQIHAGGRGKAGGVKLVNSISELEIEAGKMMGKVLITHQTGPEGKEVKKLYVEEASEISKEFYLSCLIDRETSKIAFISSTEGGMDIEKVASDTPDKIATNKINFKDKGPDEKEIENIISIFMFNDQQKIVASKLIKSLYKILVEKDASLIEINPLVITKENKIICLDAKMNFDDNAIFRRPEILKLRDLNEEEPAEIEASKYDLAYIKLNGSIGCMVNGAGLAMATMDIIKLYGEEPANFLDVGGGASKEKVAAAFKLILSDESVKGILINIFGGIMRCDVLAQGVVDAAKEINLNVPLVVRLAGTNFKEGKEILDKSNLKILSASDLNDAAKKIVEAIK